MVPTELACGCNGAGTGPAGLADGGRMHDGAVARRRAEPEAAQDAATVEDIGEIWRARAA